MVAGPFAEWLTVMFGWRGALLILGGVLLNQVSQKGANDGYSRFYIFVLQKAK